MEEKTFVKEQNHLNLSKEIDFDEDEENYYEYLNDPLEEYLLKDSSIKPKSVGNAPFRKVIEEPENFEEALEDLLEEEFLKVENDDWEESSTIQGQYQSNQFESTDSNTFSKITLNYFMKYDKDANVKSEQEQYEEIMQAVQETKFKCCYCHQSFNTETFLSVHENNCGLNPINIERVAESKMLTKSAKPKNPLACSQCPFDAASVSDLRNHIQSHKGVFICEICGNTLASSASLATHKSRVHGSGPYNCEKCFHVSSSRDTFRQHLVRHMQEKPFICPECDYRTANKGDFKQHLKRHLNIKDEFPCDVCGKVLTKSTYLTAHKRLHTRELFSCPHCPHKSNTRTFLKRHIKFKHTGEMKMFECSECSYKTPFKLSLTYHLRTHTGERPYLCGLCPYRSAAPGALYSHIRGRHTDDKRYKCSECPYSSAYGGRLTKHRLMHTDERPFPCRYCKYRSKDNITLVRHMSKRHSAKV